MIKAKELIRKLDGFTNYICWMWKNENYVVVTEKMLVLNDYEVLEVSANKLGEISIQVRRIEG